MANAPFVRNDVRKIRSVVRTIASLIGGCKGCYITGFEES